MEEEEARSYSSFQLSQDEIGKIQAILFFKASTAISVQNRVLWLEILVWIILVDYCYNWNYGIQLVLLRQLGKP